MLKLKCQVCGETSKIRSSIKEGFADVAYGDFIEWADFNNNPPPLAEATWERSSVVPKKGQRRLLKVWFPFCFNEGDLFKTLYQPALSYLNGWEEYPDEIEESAIVTLKFHSTVDASEHFAWIYADITEVIMTGDLHKAYPETYSKAPIENFDVSEKPVFFEYKNWTYCSWSAQSDLGQWKLIYKDSTGVKHLVLFGQWEFHQHNVYCGNIVYRK